MPPRKGGLIEEVLTTHDPLKRAVDWGSALRFPRVLDFARRGYAKI